MDKTIDKNSLTVNYFESVWTKVLHRGRGPEIRKISTSNYVKFSNEFKHFLKHLKIIKSTAKCLPFQTSQGR